MLSEGVNEGLIRLKKHGPNKGLMTIYGKSGGWQKPDIIIYRVIDPISDGSGVQIQGSRI
jgi:hypothetical protein